MHWAPTTSMEVLAKQRGVEGGLGHMGSAEKVEGTPKKAQFTDTIT